MAHCTEDNGRDHRVPCTRWSSTGLVPRCTLPGSELRSDPTGSTEIGLLLFGPSYYRLECRRRKWEREPPPISEHQPPRPLIPLLRTLSPVNHEKELLAVITSREWITPVSYTSYWRLVTLMDANCWELLILNK